MMECYKKNCKYNQNNLCLVKPHYDKCMSAISTILGNDDIVNVTCSFCDAFHAPVGDWMSGQPVSVRYIDDNDIDVDNISLIKDESNNKAVMLINNHQQKSCYVNISFCPMCGKRLFNEDSKK